MKYEHTQSGRFLLMALGAVALVVMILAAIDHDVLPVLVVLPVIALVAWLFSSLTVTVADERLSIRFGPGLVRISWPLREITDARPLTNPWVYGLGIHHTPEGWLYNVGGRRAVEITLRSGRRRRIGSDEAEALTRAIRRGAGLDG
jgi:hypothetical protein